MSITDLIAIFHHRWSAPVLAELLRQKGSRFAALVGTLGVGRESLRRTLDSLLELGLVARNPGYGHPLRPEYVLTRSGEVAARRCAKLLERSTRTRCSSASGRCPCSPRSRSRRASRSCAPHCRA